MRKPALQKSTEPLAWDDLRTVLAVAREGSLSGAARALQVEHSTVFRRLKGIERRFGAALFERTRSGYVPTAHGEAAAESARVMEEAALAAERRVLGADVRLSGVVRISASEMFASYLLPRALPGFLEAHPQIEVEVDVSNRTVDLTRREADLALRATNQPPEHLYGREVGKLRFAVFAHQRYFRAGRPPALEELPWIGFDDSIRRIDIARWMEQRLPGLRTRLRFDSLIAVMQAAAAGLGAAILPLFAADWQPGLRRVTGVLDEPQVSLWVLNHAEVRENARVRALSRHLAQGAAGGAGGLAEAGAGAVTGGGLLGRSAAASARQFGNQHQQVGHRQVLAGLRQQGGDLAAVVGLVVEEVHEQGAEVFAEGHALGVLVVERVRQVGVAQHGGPGGDHAVQHLAMGTQGGKFREQDLVQGAGHGQRRRRLQRGEARRVQGETLEPDVIRHHQVVEGAKDGLEESAAVGGQFLGRELGGGGVHLAIHPGVVF